MCVFKIKMHCASEILKPMRQKASFKDHHSHSRHSVKALLIAKICIMNLLPWLQDDEYQLHGTGSEYSLLEEPDISQRPIEEGRV